MTELAELEVENSPIEAGGRARVNEELMKEAELEDGQMIVVSSENKDILVSAYSDYMIEREKISLRGKDRKKLGVQEGDKVTVREHKKLLQKLL